MGEGPEFRFRARAVDDRGRRRTIFVTVPIVGDHTGREHVHLTGAEVTSLARTAFNDREPADWDVYEVTPLDACPIGIPHQPHGHCAKFPPHHPEDSP
jgi:hypothetical protein